MSTEYYTASGQPGSHSSGQSSTVRSEFTSIESGFAKLPALSGNGGEIVAINAGGTGMESKTIAEIGLMSASNFPNVNAAVNASDEELNFLVGVTSAVQTQLSARVPSSFFPNVNAAANPSDEELNFVVGATSSIQTQINNRAAKGANTDITSLQSACTVTTQAAGNNSTRIASTEFVATSFAPLASPALTGNPTAPTPTATDNDTSIATTAFVNNFENDQAWSNLTGTRLNNTDYTNNTGRPITIRVGSTSSALGVISIIFTLNGVAMPGSVAYAHGAGYTHIDTLIVPNGATYKAVATLGISSWWEYS